MRLRLLPILALSAIALSCTKTPDGVPSVVLMGQPLHDGTPNGPILGGPEKGAVVYYLGEMSADSISMKVGYEGKVGWISSVAVVVNSKPAIVTGGGLYYFSPDNANAAAALPPGTLVAMDTIINDRAHVHFSLTYGSIGDAWVTATDLTTDPEELAFALVLDDISDQSKAARATRYAEMFPQHPGSPLISEVNIDLSEASDEAIAGMQRTFPIVLDKTGNKLLTTRSEIEAQVLAYGDDILAGPVQYSFAEIRPRSIYYQRYTTQLPSFVKLPSVSEYSGYIDKLGDEQSWRAYFLYRVDRSPENIRRLYDAYGGILRQVASKYPIGDYVNALIQTYDHITHLPNYKKVCADIRTDIDNWDESHKRDDGSTEGGFILESQRGVYESILAPAIVERWDVTSTVWYHSFWIRRFAEGNAEIVYNILQDLSTLSFPGNDVEYGDEVADEPDESFDSPFEGGSEEETTICTFQEFSVGDCGHIIFDCGDYGDAETDQLSEAERQLWSSLMLSDNEGDRANPDFVGKKFEIRERIVPGEVCAEGGSTRGQVSRLLSFTRVD